MHDCRAFTGQCPYFDEVNCFRWKIGCGQCPICEAKIDNTHMTWNIRRKWQTRIRRMVIVTPSEWLANYVKESFFKNYPVKVIYNGLTKYICAASYDNAGTYDNMVTCTKTVTTYTDEPVYKNVTYYRYRDKTLSSNVDTKWSDCDDNSLIEQGYVKTGKED